MVAFLGDLVFYLAVVLVTAVMAYLLPKLIAAGVLRAYQEYRERIDSNTRR